MIHAKLLAYITLMLMTFAFVRESSAATVSSVVTRPFDPHRNELYIPQTLWTDYDSDPARNKSLDWKIFSYFTKATKYNPLKDELQAQRSHDTGMDDSIRRFFKMDELGAPTNKKVVVIMGSHSIFRSDLRYQKVARLSYALTKAGFYVVTGGGPGMMEAAHVGAYMSNYSPTQLTDALSVLASSSIPQTDSSLKQYEMLDYWSKAKQVTAKYPNGADSLGIPTWFYGHEGANAFSLHIAKYFSNALREEKICALGFYGAIFADGGPGTQQEAFMDAAQNGYASYNWYSPMIFFSTKPEAQTMKELIIKTTSSAYRQLDMVTVNDDADSVVDFLLQHPPVKKAHL